MIFRNMYCQMKNLVNVLNGVCLNRGYEVKMQIKDVGGNRFSVCSKFDRGILNCGRKEGTVFDGRRDNKKGKDA